MGHQGMVNNVVGWKLVALMVFVAVFFSIYMNSSDPDVANRHCVLLTERARNSEIQLHLKNVASKITSADKYTDLLFSTRSMTSEQKIAVFREIDFDWKKLYSDISYIQIGFKGTKVLGEASFRAKNVVRVDFGIGRQYISYSVPNGMSTKYMNENSKLIETRVDSDFSVYCE